MSEVLAELFSGNQAADIAFWIIVGLSFLLGMLLFALLAYWPATVSYTHLTLPTTPYV